MFFEHDPIKQVKREVSEAINLWFGLPSHLNENSVEVVYYMGMKHKKWKPTTFGKLSVS